MFVCLSQDGTAAVVFVSRPQVDCLSLSWWKLTEPNFTAAPPVVCSGRFRAVPFSLVLLSYLMSNFQCPRASGGVPRSARQSYGEIPNCQNCFAILTFFIVPSAPPGCLSGRCFPKASAKVGPFSEPAKCFRGKMCFKA